MQAFRMAMAISILAAATEIADDPKPAEGFKSLFNGTDLKGWKVHGGMMDVWGAEKGLLYCDKKGGGWLLTEEEFTDFELRCEFRWTTEGGNSGVGLRV